MKPNPNKLDLVGANIITGDGSDPVRNARVEIENGRIIGVTTGGGNRDPATTFDFEGRWLLPGLIDSHVHIVLDGGPDQLANYAQFDKTYFAFIAAQSIRRSLLSGITTLRDVVG